MTDILSTGVAGGVVVHGIWTQANQGEGQARAGETVASTVDGMEKIGLVHGFSLG